MDSAHDAREGPEGHPGSELQEGVANSSVKQDNLLVFDWDDTILPTSWLERIHALTGGAPLRPEVSRQIAALCAVASKTLTMAATLGNVVIITNSAPGWVDQSCQLFMPQILQQIRSIPIFAKPMRAPLTFKITTFRREVRQYRNLISVGDGDAERAASRRLLSPPDAARRPGAQSSGDVGNLLVKSIKLLELPTCQHLISQHEMLLVRLADVVNFQGCLDLKARFPGMGAGSPAPRGSIPMGAAGPGGAAGSKADDVQCTLVHCARPLGGREQSAPPLRNASGVSTPGPPLPPAHPSQLPPLGRAGISSDDGDLPLLRGGGMTPVRGGGGTTPAAGEHAIATASSIGAEAGGGSNSPVSAAPAGTAGGRGAGVVAPVPPPGQSLWRVQHPGGDTPGGTGRGGRSLYHPGVGKKRPPVLSGVAGRSGAPAPTGGGAVWREHSVSGPRGH